MKYVVVVAVCCLVVLCAVRSSQTASPPARNMTPTIYNDGRSCPGNCDAHVVFNGVHNGTRNAFSPLSNRAHPVNCSLGQPCTICFSEDDASCMTATYRGGGPEVGRFDFTPAFYQENCDQDNLPIVFARQCRSAQPALARLRGQINCVANPDHPRCLTMMQAAARRKAADDLLYTECKTLGQTAFNRKYRQQPQLQRVFDCAYERQLRGGGGRWHRLLDGACRDGNFAGRDGLDCCSGNLYEAAMLGPECRGFFINP